MKQLSINSKLSNDTSMDNLLNSSLKSSIFIFISFAYLAMAMAWNIRSEETEIG
jgi:hypothetical protein